MPLNGDDIDLMSALHRRERGAFTIFHERTVAALCYFTEAKIGERVAAEDIATDAFVKAFERITDFANIAALKSFLYVTAGNESINFLKARSRHQAAHREINHTAEYTAADVELEFIRAEVLHTIYREIDKLTGHARDVIRLSILEGKTIDEVAAEMNLSYKTVQHYKTQGLKLLRISLSGNEPLSITGIITYLLFFSDK